MTSTDTASGTIRYWGMGETSWTVPTGTYYYVVSRASSAMLLYPLTTTSQVTFHTDGGKVDASNPTYTLRQYLTDYCDVSWLNPQKNGYTFAGWYTSDLKTQVYDAAGKAVSGTYWSNNAWQGSGNKDFVAKWINPISYTVTYNANGGSGTMSNQAFTYDAAQNLKANTFTYNPTLSFNENGGDAVTDATIAASFGGWEDRSTTSYYGTTYKYTDFDAPGYAQRNPDVFNHASYGNGIYNTTAMIDHYVRYGKSEQANGSTNRAPRTSMFYTYPNGTKVTNLTTIAGGTVPLYAKWNYGNTVLPTPTRAGHTFAGWQADLMDIAGTLVNNTGINTTYGGFVGYSQYAANPIMIPVVGGTTFTSNFEVCGIYSYDKDGNFIKRESSYATTHTVSDNAAFVRVEVNLKKDITLAQYQNDLTLTYVLPGGITYPVGGNQTMTALWTEKLYTVTWKNHDGTVLETDTGLRYNDPVVYNGVTPIKPDDAEFTYTFAGWSEPVTTANGDVEYTAQFTAVSKRVEPTYTVTIPATVNEGESFTVKATGVVLNTDETLTVTLQSDFTFVNRQNVTLPFVINNGAVGNNTAVLSINGNGDKSNPLAADSGSYTVSAAEAPKYAGTYTGMITFVIAVTTAENNESN